MYENDYVILLIIRKKKKNNRKKIIIIIIIIKVKGRKKKEKRLCRCCHATEYAHAEFFFRITPRRMQRIYPHP